jgi:predicted GIY-YIG superfamily endonuclease
VTIELVNEEDVKGYYKVEKATKEIRTGHDVLEYLLFGSEHLNMYDIRIMDFAIDLPLRNIDYYNIKDRFRNKGKFGTYVFNDDNELIYIGSSMNVEERVAYHEKRKYSSFVSMFMTNSYQEAYDLENILITELRPKLNHRVWNKIENKRRV